MLQHKSRSLDPLGAAADVVYGQCEQVGVIVHGPALTAPNQPRTPDCSPPVFLGRTNAPTKEDADY